MIPVISWLASVAKASGAWLDRKAVEMQARRVKYLVSKASLTKGQAKELEALVEKLPEVTVDRRP